MTDRSDDLVNIVAEALRDADRRFHRIDPRYFPRMAQAAIDALGFTDLTEFERLMLVNILRITREQAEKFKRGDDDQD